MICIEQLLTNRGDLISDFESYMNTGLVERTGKIIACTVCTVYRHTVQ